MIGKFFIDGDSLRHFAKGTNPILHCTILLAIYFSIPVLLCFFFDYISIIQNWTTINLVPLFGLIVLDVLGIGRLWKERIVRRVLHHVQSCNYNSHKVPVLYRMKEMFSDKQISTVLNLDLKEKESSLNTMSLTISQLFGGQYSKRSSFYYNDFDADTKLIFEGLALELKPKLEELCGEELQLGESDFRCILLRYEGSDASFAWHYDTEPPNCYRTLTLIKKDGTIPPFCYRGAQQKIQKVELDLGEGIFFKGTQAYHMVDRSRDEKTVRWMLGFQYCAGDYPKQARSLCSELRGASVAESMQVFAPHYFLYIIVVWGAEKFAPHLRIDSLPYFVVSATIIVCSCWLPQFLTKVGTGIVSSPGSILRFFVILNLAHWWPQLAIGQYAYVLVTEMFLPSDWVSKVLRNGGS